MIIIQYCAPLFAAFSVALRLAIGLQ